MFQNKFKKIFNLNLNLDPETQRKDIQGNFTVKKMLDARFNRNKIVTVYGILSKFDSINKQIYLLDENNDEFILILKYSWDDYLFHFEIGNIYRFEDVILYFKNEKHLASSFRIICFDTYTKDVTKSFRYNIEFFPNLTENDYEIVHKLVNLQSKNLLRNRLSNINPNKDRYLDIHVQLIGYYLFQKTIILIVWDGTQPNLKTNLIEKSNLVKVIKNKNLEKLAKDKLIYVYIYEDQIEKILDFKTKDYIVLCNLTIKKPNKNFNFNKIYLSKTQIYGKDIRYLDEFSIIGINLTKQINSNNQIENLNYNLNFTNIEWNYSKFNKNLLLNLPKNFNLNQFEQYDSFKSFLNKNKNMNVELRFLLKMYVLDFFPGKNQIWNFFDLIYFICTKCKFKESIGSLFVDDLPRIIKIILKKTTNQIPSFKLDCLNCKNKQCITLTFFIPFLLRDNDEQSLVAILKTENAGHLLNLTTNKLLFNYEHQNYVFNLLTKLSNSCIEQDNFKLIKFFNFSLSKNRNTYMIENIFELED